MAGDEEKNKQLWINFLDSFTSITLHIISSGNITKRKGSLIGLQIFLKNLFIFL